MSRSSLEEYSGHLNDAIPLARLSSCGESRRFFLNGACTGGPGGADVSLGELEVLVLVRSSSPLYAGIQRLWLTDGSLYIRTMSSDSYPVWGGWRSVSGGGGSVGIVDAPFDSTLYGRRDGNWEEIPETSGSGTYTNSGTTVAVGGITAGTVFTDKPLSEVLDQMLSPYAPPVVSVSVSPGSASIENVPVTGTVSISVTKKSNPLSPSVSISGLGISTTGTVSAGGGSVGSFAFSGITASGSVTATVYDGRQNTTGTGTFTVYYPALWGVYASSPADMDTIKATGIRIVSGKQNPFNVPLNGTGYAAFAYPAEYGNLASIIDPNGFNVTSGWQKQTWTFTTGSYSKSYNVYIMQSVSAYTGTNYKFNF